MLSKVVLDLHSPQYGGSILLPLTTANSVSKPEHGVWNWNVCTTDRSATGVGVLFLHLGISLFHPDNTKILVQLMTKL